MEREQVIYGRFQAIIDHTTERVELYYWNSEDREWKSKLVIDFALWHQLVKVVEMTDDQLQP